MDGQESFSTNDSGTRIHTIYNNEIFYAAENPEPDNEKDENAILVYYDDEKLGYLPRDIAAQYIGEVNQYIQDGQNYASMNAL